MAFVHASRVRFVDTDASGRIHYTAMLRHFEAAESEFFQASGLRYEEVQNSGLGWPRSGVSFRLMAGLVPQPTWGQTGSMNASKISTTPCLRKINWSYAAVRPHRRRS